MAISFDSSSICQRENENCTGSYNIYYKFQTSCEKFDCFGDLNYTCGSNNCAADRKSCYYFQTLNSNLIRIIISPTSYKYNLRKYEKELQMIKSCTAPFQDWNTNDVCIRSNECFLKHDFLFFNKMYNMKKKINCFCDQTHKYQCNNKYCATNKQVCDDLLLKLSHESINKTNFNKCNHRSNVIERKIVF